MTATLYDAPNAPNPFTVRLLIAERGGITLKVETIDLVNLVNGEPKFLAINPFGTVPALVLDDGTVISDIVAVCEYLDDTAIGGVSLIGSTATERALVRMWTRRVDKDIAQRFISWWRGSDDAIAYYRAHRVLELAGREENKRMAEQHLDMLESRFAELGVDFIVGDAPRLPDILLFGFMSTMAPAIPWLMDSRRPHITAWFNRMEARPAVQEARKRVESVAG